MRPLDPRVLPHLRPARTTLAAVVVGQVLVGGLVVAQAFAVTALVVAVVSSSSWQLLAVAVVVVSGARALAGWGVDVASARAAARVGTELRRTVLRRALDLDAASLAGLSKGSLATLATRGVAATEPYLTRYLPALVVAAVLPPLVVAAIATQDVVAAVVVLATLPLVPVFAALIGLSTRDRAQRQWAALSQLSGHFVDVVRGLPTLVAHGRAHAQSTRIREVTDRYRRANAAVLRLAFASSVALELVATLSVALVAVVTGLRLASGHLSLSTALVVLLLAPEAYWPLRRVGAEFHAAAEGTATFEAVAALQEAPPEALGVAVALPADLRLRGVSLTWPGRTSPAIAHLDAVVPATGLTVLAGPSGSGKSSVLAALLGELSVSGGTIEVGTTPLGDVFAWPPRVAHVPQQPWLTDGTVADNVRIGRPAASDDCVREALDRVGLEALALDLPLGEDGAGLSAGQRARLAMARVVVSDRPVVLLDEPTAHLDLATERVLLSVVRNLAVTRTVVAVAHRPSWLEAADHTITLASPTLPSHPPTRRDVADAHPRPAETSQTRTSSDETATSRRESGASPRRVGGFEIAGLLGVLASTSGVALTGTAGWLITRASEHPPVLMLMVAIVGVRTFGLARPVLRYAERLLSHDVALRLLAEHRAQVFDLVVPLVPARLGRHRGDLLASLVDDVDALLDRQLRVRLPLRVWLGTTATTGAALLLLSVPVAITVTAGSLAVGALTWACARHGARRAGPAAVEARAEVSRRALTVLTDARHLVGWQVDDAALERVGVADERRARATRVGARWTALARSWPGLGAGLGSVGVAALVGDVSAPVAALLVLVPLALADVVAPVADAGALGVGVRAATARIEALGATAPAVTDPVDPVPAPLGGPVALDRVCAAWAPGAPPALPPVDLELLPGRAVAVVGPSGSGKSTLVAVLVRFLAPESGRHTVDALPVGRYRVDDVRRLVGLLDDDPFLFASNVGENVRLARPDATDADVERALRSARLGDWLDALPDGLGTRIGDGAMSVSGGERARIGVARLLLADHAVLVLDEPTAHLDSDTARAVSDELLDHATGRGVVWITHDDAVLERVDAVLDLGTSATHRAPAYLDPPLGR